MKFSRLLLLLLDLLVAALTLQKNLLQNLLYQNGMNVIDLTSNSSEYVTRQKFSALSFRPVAGFDEFTRPRDDNPYYIINSLQDVTTKHKDKLEDRNNRFLIKEDLSGVFFNETEDSWIHRDFPSEDSLKYISYDLAEKGCFDNSMGESGSFGKGVTFSLSAAYTRSVDAGINLFLLRWRYQFELEIGASVSFKSGVSCDIGKGEYGRVWATIYQVEAPPSRKTYLNFNQDGGYESGQSEYEEGFSFVLNKMPTVTCHTSYLPCA